eukprot:4780-Chlamydomonas_euryale.AAC.1
MCRIRLSSYPSAPSCGPQAEEAQLSGLVESLTRKNRHLAKELADAQRSNEEMFEAQMKAQVAAAAGAAQLDGLKRQRDAEAAAQ